MLWRCFCSKKIAVVRDPNPEPGRIGLDWKAMGGEWHCLECLQTLPYHRMDHYIRIAENNLMPWHLDEDDAPEHALNKAKERQNQLHASMNSLTDDGQLHASLKHLTHDYLN